MSDSLDVVGDPPQSMLLAIEQLISGERSIAEFRDEMLNTIYDAPTCVQAVRAMVDDYAQRGLIPEQIHRLLSRDIDKTSDEDLATAPTEFTFTADTHGSTQENTASVDLAPSPVVEQPAQNKKRESPLEIGSLLRDRFEIVGRASGGSMGVVFKAIDRRLAEAEGGQPYVAIKLLAPEYAGHSGAMRALQQEATKGRYLNHPNIVRFLDLDRSGDDIFLVMEWLTGRPLSAILNQNPGQPMEVEQAWSIITSLGDALQHAHDLGVTHADVKPGNIMIQPDGELKLLDFGIARARGDLAARAKGADPRILNAATPAYASPQVLAGDAAKPVDDIFSLACVAYRLLSGQRVFRDKSAKQADEQGLVPRRVPGLSQRRWHALQTALSLDPEKRFQSVADFMRALGIGAQHQGASWQPLLVIATCVVTVAVLSVLALRAPDQTNALDGEPVTVVTLTPETLDAPVADKVPIPSIGPETDPAAVDVPVIEFLVTDAEWQDAQASNSPALSMMLPSRDSVVPALVAALDIVEGAPVTSIMLQRNDIELPRALRLVRQSADEASMIALSGRVALQSRSIELAAGQSSARIQVAISDDSLLTPVLEDRYHLYDSDSNELLARLSLRILDDEAQALDPAPAANTLTFSSDEIVVQESDLVVRIPVWRLNADASDVSTSITVISDSAVVDDDFIADAQLDMTFDQGSDRLLLLVPLVSDSRVEPEEQFSLRMSDTNEAPGTHQQITVRILDQQNEP